MEKWKLISSKRAFDNKWVKLRQDTVELPNGKILNDYFVWESGDVVLVVPVTSEEKFVLVRQYKHGADEIVTEVPAGFMDENETPEQAAHREMEEETGYSSKEMKLLTTVHANPTKSNGKGFIFLAKDAIQNKEVNFDETEDIEILLKSKDEVLQMIQGGEICVGDSIAAIYLAIEKLNKL